MTGRKIDLAIARKMRGDGASYSAIGQFFGVTPTAVRYAFGFRPDGAGYVIKVPPWCPKWFREDYHRLGRLYGEEIAARHAREAMREARKCA